MWSSFKFITAKNSPIFKDWYDNRDLAYENSPIESKLFFLMNQCIMLSYLNKAYDSMVSSNTSRVYDNGFLYLITNYKNDFIIPAINELRNKIQYFENSKVTEEILEQLNILINDSTIRINSELCISTLTQYRSDLVPCAFENNDASFYRPYLLFVEKAVSTETLLDANIIDKAHSFKIVDDVTIPSFSVTADNLFVVSYEQRFSSYVYDPKKDIELDKTLNIGPSSIFSFLYGYDWSSWTFNGFLGVLASMCLELDANVIPQSSLMWVYYFLYRTVFGWTPHAKTRSNSLALSSNINLARRCVLTFIAAVCNRHKVKVDDTNLLGDLLSDSKDDTADNLHKYLNAKDASSVSVEMYTAFKRSIFGTFEELDFKKSKKQSLDKIMTLQARSDKEVSPSIANVNSISALPQYLRDSTFGLESVLIETGNRIKLAKNAAGGIYFNAEAEQEKDEATPEEEADSKKPENPDSDDMNPDEDPVTMPESNNEEMEDEDTHTQQPLPQVSDKRGIKLDLSLNENTDTVLYRFELKAYVDALLANPPKYLDVQTISYLKKLKAFWWNCLSVQTLYDVLNTMVKVPKAYRIKPTRNNNE